MAGSREENLVGEIIREFSVAKEGRGTWDTHWEEVARIVLPQYSTTFNGNPYLSGGGQKRSQHQFDTTANAALTRFAAAMESMLTPRNQKWHRLKIADPSLSKMRHVQLWLDQVNDLLFRYRYAPKANYGSQQHDGYMTIGAFGSSCLFIDPFKDATMPGAKGMRYRNVHLGEVYFNENHQGQVDRLYRRFPMQVFQIAEKWGEDALGDKHRGKLQTKPTEKLWVIHSVRPRQAWDPYRLDAKGMPFESCYVLEDTHVLLEESGYRKFPYATARYITAPGEVYGRSPAMNVLPSIKVLNEEKATLLKQGHRAVDPVLLAHDDGVLDGFSLKPGAINYGSMTADGKRLVDVLPSGQVQVSKELMDDERMAINDAFLVTLFQIATESPQMTATEVLERAREKGALLSPTMSRFQSESLGPMIEREYDILWHQGLIPTPPPELVEAGAEMDVEYDAPLNRAMRSEGIAGVQRSAQFAAEIATQTQDPSVMDWFNWDAIIPETADANGAPFRFINDASTVAAKRKGREQQQAVQQAIDAGPAAAAMMKAAAPQGNQAGGP